MSDPDEDLFAWGWGPNAALRDKAAEMLAEEEEQDV